MSDKSIINIKSLPEAAEISIGDFFLVENRFGTQLLDFNNFVITEFNTTFGGLLSSHTTNIISLNVSTATLSTSIGTLENIWTRNYNTNTIYTLSSVGIGLTTPLEKLTVNGNISASGKLSINSISAIGGISFFKTGVGIGTPVVVAGSILDVIGRVNISDVTGNDRTDLSFNTDQGGLRLFNKHTSSLILGTSNTERLRISVDGNVGIGLNGASPITTLHIGSVSACMTLQQSTHTPVNPDVDTDGRLYIKSSKLVVQYNDGVAVRYKYLVLSGTDVTWVHSTTAP